MKTKFIVSFYLLFIYAVCFSQKTDKNYYTQYYQNKRIVIIMFDGFGMSYFNQSELPNIKKLMHKGVFKEVNSLMPTVTNCNNAAICCGTFPNANGITGNSFLSPEGKEEYMENKELVLSPTIFEKLKMYNKKSALISSKKKSISLLSKGTEIALSAETTDSSWINKLGKPASIYSSEINYWSMEAAIYILKNRKDISCLYIHTTDYPMHTWTPEDSNSKKHISMIDEYIGAIAKIAPDAIIMITADHDVNHKNKCIDIEKSLAQQNISIRMAISAERDKYLKHHRGFGGTSYVYLKNANDEVKVKTALLKIQGVKTVLSKREALEKYNLFSDRIGDMVVLADSLTVFGSIETAEEKLPDTYRTHGSEYELKVPLIILNAAQIPNRSYFIFNKDLTSWLFEKPKD